MLVEIPDPMVILGIVLGFLAGAVVLFLYSKLRLIGSLQNNNPSDNQRLEYYEKQFIDMKIRLDALNLDNEEPLGEDEMVKIQSEMVKSPSRKERRSRVMVEKHAPVNRIPNMSSEDSVKHVLKLITKKPMTSRDIEVTFGGRSREHVSRLMKKLFDDGLVERNTTNRPYTYSITDSGRKHIGEENLVYAVSS
ncbi:MAG: MarR family transcriptional regulator [Candidatus Nitrosopelagicus sp.]